VLTWLGALLFAAALNRAGVHLFFLLLPAWLFTMLVYTVLARAAMAVFIFDIGKTNLKCHILDDRGNSIWSVSRENRAAAPPYPHFALDDIWAWLLQSLSEAGSLYALSAINISTQDACAVLLDAAGEILFPVMDYEWDGLWEDSESYAAVRPDFEQTQHRAGRRRPLR